MQKIINIKVGWSLVLFPSGSLLKIHPFVDGNGRTARLLMNFELIQSGYPAVVIKTENRADYYDALDKAHTTNDYTDFIRIELLT